MGVNRPADTSGRIRRINGPLVEVDGLPPTVALADTVEIGSRNLVGEVVHVSEDRITAQVYESTAGVRAGERVRARPWPLSAPLGPGLLGRVFDGILRPLDEAPTWLVPGGQPSRARSMRFAPLIEAGAQVGPGTRIGTAVTSTNIEEAVVVPPGVQGSLDWVSPPGETDWGGSVATVAGRQVPVVQHWPVRTQRPHLERLRTDVPLITGQRVLDVLFPVAQGSTAAVVGGFGTGKTVLLQQIAKWCDADVIVYVGCGERGNELADTLDELRQLEDPRTGRMLMERTVIIANTSNMPVMAREASIYTGMTVAEYFRDQGLHAVLIADSTSRWAEAQREFASRLGQLPAEEGYPAGLASALAAFYERAGRVRTLSGAEGSVTVVAAVSPPGGDLTEPVTAHTQRFVRCLWTLDRDLAYGRHYPAVSWRSSFSRDADGLASWYVEQGDPGWQARRTRTAALLAQADHLRSVAELVGEAALPGRERVVLLTARLVRDGVLRQSALDANDAACGTAKQAALFDAALAVHDAAQRLVDAGRPAAVLEEVDLSRLVQAASQVGRDDAAGVARRRDEVLALLTREQD